MRADVWHRQSARGAANSRAPERNRSYPIHVAKCPYCEASPEELWASMEDAIAMPHPDPLTACNVVVAPRRHVAAFYDLDVQEQRAVWHLVGEIQKRITAAIKVEGFAVRFADGDAENGAH